MPKIQVDTSQAFCAKRGCKERSMHRHHRGHEYLFVSKWMGSKDKQKVTFVKRYWKFRERDIVRLCDKHHAEVHLDLDVEILKDIRDSTKKSLTLYSFKEAMQLVRKLRKYTDNWVHRETPGVNPDLVFGKKLFSGRKRRGVATRRYYDDLKENEDA